MNLQGFPFGTGAPFRSGDPYLGGEIVVLPVGSANPNTLIAHTLRRLPRAFLVLDVGTQVFGVSIPFPRGATPWSQSQFSLSLPILSTPVVGVLI
jgi:hypothetical protein